MGRTTTFEGRLRSFGGNAFRGKRTASGIVYSATVTFVPSAATATAVRVGTEASTVNGTVGETLWLPKGAIPQYTVTHIPAFGTNPTVDWGYILEDGTAAVAGIENEWNSSALTLQVIGNTAYQSGDTPFIQPAQVTARTGASASTGTFMTVTLFWTIQEDSKAESEV